MPTKKKAVKKTKRAKGSKITAAKKKVTELSLVKQKDDIRKDLDKNTKIFDKNIELNKKVMDKAADQINKWQTKKTEFEGKSISKINALEEKIKKMFHKEMEKLVVSDAPVVTEVTQEKIPF